MNKTHTGKIGRLPRAIRDQLNQRLDDSLPGADLAHWLNSLPDVQEILKQHFDSRPISEQNVSDWKHSGHLEWLRHQESRQAAQRLIEDSDDLRQATHERRLSDSFATVLAAEIPRLAMALLEQETDPEKKWQRLCHINHELSQLRRDDHRAMAATIQRERWEMESLLTRLKEEERLNAADKEKMIEMLFHSDERLTNAQLFGGGEAGRAKAEMLYRLKCDLPYEDILDGTWEKMREVETACPRNEKVEEPKPKPVKKPVKRKKSSLIKAAKTRPQSKTARSASAQSVAQPPEPPRPTCQISPIGPIPSAPTPSDPIQPLPQPVGRVSSHGVGSPSVTQPSEQSRPTCSTTTLDTITQSSGAPGTAPASFENQTTSSPSDHCHTPAPDPKTEAYNRWFRMNNGAEPFDYEELQRLYAKIPPEDQENELEDNPV